MAEVEAEAEAEVPRPPVAPPTAGSASAQAPARVLAPARVPARAQLRVRERASEPLIPLWTETVTVTEIATRTAIGTRTETETRTAIGTRTKIAIRTATAIAILSVSKDRCDRLAKPVRTRDEPSRAIGGAFETAMRRGEAVDRLGAVGLIGSEHQPEYGLRRGGAQCPILPLPTNSAAVGPGLWLLAFKSRKRGLPACTWKSHMPLTAAVPPAPRHQPRRWAAL